jgi:hypothetical protein
MVFILGRCVWQINAQKFDAANFDFSIFLFYVVKRAQHLPKLAHLTSLNQQKLKYQKSLHQISAD